MNSYCHNINDPGEAYYVGLMHACGYDKTDLEKPVIGIVNSYTDVNPVISRLKNWLRRFATVSLWRAALLLNFRFPHPATDWLRAAACTISCPSVSL